jgi:8-oxo-dGTP pyrophosphatase MutT (NUDIX family)
MSNEPEIRPEFLLTADIALVIGRGDERSLCLITSDKFPGLLMLPGGHRTSLDLTIAHTAAEESWQEIGYEIHPETMDDHLFMVLSGKNRNPRPKYARGNAPDKDKIIDRMSVVYLFEEDQIPSGLRAGDDATSIQFRPLRQITAPMMAYDHYLVVERLHKHYNITCITGG